ACPGPGRLPPAGPGPVAWPLASSSSADVTTGEGPDGSDGTPPRTMISLVAAAAAASRAPGSRAGVVTSTPARAEVSCAETSDLVASGLRPVTVPPAAIAPSAI